MFLKLWRWLMSYVVFEVHAYDPGEVLSTLLVCGKIFGIRKQNGVVTACCEPAAYKKMRRHVRRTGGRLKIKKKVGLKFFLFKKRGRFGILLGIGIFFAILFVLSRFVWTIQFEGGTEEIREIMRTRLPAYGVKIGTLKSKLDPRSLKNKILLENPEISFIAINIAGGKVTINLDDSDERPQIDPLKQYANIVAEKGGRIVDLQVYDGRAEIKKGDWVLPGDLLVSGTIEDRLGRVLFTKASASIKAETENTIVVRIPAVQNVPVPTGKVVKKHYLSIYGITVPLHWHFFLRGYWTDEVKGTRASAGGIDLPVFMTEVTLSQVKYQLTEFSDEELLNQAMEALTADRDDIFGETEILSEQLDFGREGDFFVLRATYKCLEEIAVVREFETDSPLP